MSTQTTTLELLQQQFDPYLCQIHPCLYLRHVRCVDNTTGDEFKFHFSPDQLIRWATTPNQFADTVFPLDVATDLLSDPDYVETGWEWQGDLIDWWVRSDISIMLKARQLGITWCAAGVHSWFLDWRPGTRTLIQSKNEVDASDVVDHVWEIRQSLKDRPDLTNHTKVHKPSRGRPHLDIEVVHRDGRMSLLNAMASTEGAGHGRTAAWVTLDEFSRHPYARGAYKAIVPAQGGSVRSSGKTVIISTANGISTDEESGNFYHHLWSNAAYYGIRTRFLRWDQNPDRDQAWYERVAMKLPEKDRGEQYPRNPEEAFILTGDVYFDTSALKLYAENGVEEPLYRGLFKDGALERREFGALAIFKDPEPGHRYAIGADVATAVGKDFSAAYVIDLETMELVAEFHHKIDPDEYAYQLYWLGMFYNEAWLAVEMGGGYGEAVIIPLRDGRQGRPPYRRLFRHTPEDRIERNRSKGFGFPITVKTRPLIISQLEQAIREHELPWMTEGLLSECQTFVKQNTRPSPRAQEGCNDDRVMAAALTLEMFRVYGHRELSSTVAPAQPKWTDIPASYPWQRRPNPLSKRLATRYRGE